MAIMSANILGFVENVRCLYIINGTGTFKNTFVRKIELYIFI